MNQALRRPSAQPSHLGPSAQHKRASSTEPAPQAGAIEHPVVPDRAHRQHQESSSDTDCSARAQCNGHMQHMPRSGAPDSKKRQLSEQLSGPQPAAASPRGGGQPGMQRFPNAGPAYHLLRDAHASNSRFAGLRSNLASALDQPLPAVVLHSEAANRILSDDQAALHRLQPDILPDSKAVPREQPLTQCSVSEAGPAISDTGVQHHATRSALGMIGNSYLSGSLRGELPSQSSLQAGAGAEQPVARPGVYLATANSCSAFQHSREHDHAFHACKAPKKWACAGHPIA